MSDRQEARALQEARMLIETFGNEAPLYAAIKAKAAMEQRDLELCARWKRVLELLAEGLDGEDCAPLNANAERAR